MPKSTNSVADPDPGSGAFFDPWIRDPVPFLTPGSGMVKYQDPDPE
jgi:hypothetical protein